MLDRKWFTLNNEPIDDIKKAIEELTAEGNKDVHIGTDSQRKDRRIDFVTAIVVLTPSKGGRAYYTREKNPRFNSLREKLVKEAWMSVQTALEVEAILPESCDITIHLDANPNAKFKSSNYVKELVGMVVGQGYAYEVKPRAWCASHVSEHIVKKVPDVGHHVV